MKATIYNQEGEKIEEMELPRKIFSVPLNPNLVHQVVVAQMANRRQGTAHTKTRGEVSGGGRKPWRQKGTGRARHGSIRSPHWKGGGTVFGPRKEKKYEQKINKKMRKKALCMLLSEKARRHLMIVLEGLHVEQPRTRLLHSLLQKLPCDQKNSLLALPAFDKNTILAARNLPSIQTMQAKDLNVLDLINARYLVMPKESIDVIGQTLGEKNMKSPH